MLVGPEAVAIESRLLQSAAAVDMLWGVREQVAQIFNTMETSKRAHGIVEWGITQVRPPFVVHLSIRTS